MPERGSFRTVSETDDSLERVEEGFGFALKIDVAGFRELIADSPFPTCPLDGCRSRLPSLLCTARAHVGLLK